MWWVVEAFKHYIQWEVRSGQWLLHLVANDSNLWPLLKHPLFY